MVNSRIRMTGLRIVLLMAALSVNAQDLIDIKLPPGAIMAFALETCPMGWEQLVIAEGRFLRGMTDSEKPGDQGGHENHIHSASAEPSRAVRGVDNDKDHTVSNWDHSHAVSVAEAKHTPEYVAVLFCRLSE